MDFAIRMIGDDLVHEVEEFDAPPAFVMAPDDLAAFSARQGISESGLVEEGSWGIPSAVAAA
jgi:hypothetical protein